MAASEQINRIRRVQTAAAISELIGDISSVRGRYMTQCLRQAQAAPATAEEWQTAAANAEAWLCEMENNARVLFNLYCHEPQDG